VLRDDLGRGAVAWIFGDSKAGGTP